MFFQIALYYNDW